MNAVATASGQPQTGVMVEMAKHKGRTHVEQTEVREVIVGQASFCALEGQCLLGGVGKGGLRCEGEEAEDEELHDVVD